MSKQPQWQTVLDILKREGKVDNFRAINERITLRLAARIHTLRTKGYEIRTEELPDSNAVYHLCTPQETSNGTLPSPELPVPPLRSDQTRTGLPPGVSEGEVSSRLKSGQLYPPQANTLFPIDAPKKEGDGLGFYRI